MSGQTQRMLPVWILLSLLVSALFLALPFLPGWLNDSGFYGLRRQQDVSALDLSSVETAPLNLIFLGYLQCGTVCPQQMMNLKALHDRFQGQPVNFIFISLDPERDTAAKLNRAMSGLGKSIQAIRPAGFTEAQSLARSLADSAAIRPDAGHYEIDHSGFLYVVDAHGQLQLVYTSPALDLDRVEQDLTQLIGFIEKGKTT